MTAHYKIYTYSDVQIPIDELSKTQIANKIGIDLEADYISKCKLPQTSREWLWGINQAIEKIKLELASKPIT